jgi:xanthine dehydrogenase YagS FAD-binding subunit
VAIVIDDGLVREARIALGGVATKPWRATAAEQSLVGEPLTWEAALRAGAVAFADAEPRKASQFKMSLGPKNVAKALMIAKDRRAS